MNPEPNWDITEATIIDYLGDGPWLDLWKLFGRAINHLVIQATEEYPHPTQETQTKLRLQVLTLLPKSLEGALPFATRWVWNHKLDASQTQLFVSRLHEACLLAEATWSQSEMLEHINQILGN